MTGELRKLKRVAGLEQVLGVLGAAKLEAALQATIEWCNGTGPLMRPGAPEEYVPFAATEESREATLSLRESVRTGIVSEEEFRAMVCFVRALEESVQIVNPGDLEGGGPKILGPHGEEVH